MKEQTTEFLMTKICATADSGSVDLLEAVDSVCTAEGAPNDSYVYRLSPSPVAIDVGFRDGVIATALKRLIEGRELLGYQLSYEKGHFDESDLVAKIEEFHRAKPAPSRLVDRVRLLRGLIGEYLTSEIVALTTGASWDEAEEALVSSLAVDGCREVSR